MNLEEAFTDYCHLHKPSLAQQIFIGCDKYCFLILTEDTSFFFLIISLFFVFFFVILRYLLIFTKIILSLLFYYFFFHKNYFYFCMFRHVPECSMFLVLLTASRKSLSGGFPNTSDYLAKNHKHLSAASNSEISVKDRKQSFKTLSYTYSAFLENQ